MTATREPRRLAWARAGTLGCIPLGTRSTRFGLALALLRSQRVACSCWAPNCEEGRRQVRRGNAPTVASRSLRSRLRSMPSAALDRVAGKRGGAATLVLGPVGWGPQRSSLVRPEGGSRRRRRQDPCGLSLRSADPCAARAESSRRVGRAGGDGRAPKGAGRGRSARLRLVHAEEGSRNVVHHVRHAAGR